uniref:Uncharacterized protein n=1 Tax=Panagrolaimus sp. ES5 TaxID=591445 RepID=A0AC34F2D0_9BILA
MEHSNTVNRRDQRSFYNILAFWLQIFTVLVKLAAFAVYLYARFSRAWFINNRLNDDFEFRRDVFGSDCVYEKNTSKVEDCIASDSRELIDGHKFWGRYGIVANDVLPPKSELIFVGQIFHVMLLMLFLDFCMTIASCLCAGKLTPVCIFEPHKRPRWNFGAKFALIYALFSGLICLLYITVASIVLQERHDAFFVEVPQNEEIVHVDPAIADDRTGKVGKSFHAFCLSGIIFFCSTAMACLTYTLLINGNGGINKRSNNDDSPAAMPLHPLANPNLE